MNVMTMLMRTRMQENAEAMQVLSGAPLPVGQAFISQIPAQGPPIRNQA